MARTNIGRTHTPKPSLQQQELAAVEKTYKTLSVREMKELIDNVREKITNNQDKIKEYYKDIWLMEQVLRKKLNTETTNAE